MGSFGSKHEVENVGVIGMEDGNRATTGTDVKGPTDQKQEKETSAPPNEYNEYERFVRDWLADLRKHDPFADFDRICAMKASQPALKWLAHPKLHRHPDYKAFDSNLAAFSSDDDFWNASVVTMERNPNQKVILAQLPDFNDTDQMRSFWLMAKANNVASVHILGDSFELAQLAKCFVMESGAGFRSHGAKEPRVIVKTKQVEVNIFDDREPSEIMDKFTVDVLKTGESEALTVTVHTYPSWVRHCGPHRHSTPLRAAILINRHLDEGRTVLVASPDGAGRPGTLLALAVALRDVEQNKIPNFAHIITAIREQRPMAVDSMKQVLTLYGAVFCFMLHCPASETLSDQDELADVFLAWNSEMFHRRLRESQEATEAK